MSPEAIRLSAVTDAAATEKESSLSDETRVVREGLETPMFDNGLTPNKIKAALKH